MAVRIFIERTVSADNQTEVAELLKELRIRAIRQPGYVSGETLFSVDQPGTHMVISTWHNLRDWKAWADSPWRKEVLDKIEQLLTTPPKVSVYSESPRGLAEGV